jgi:hypothetical protein
MIEVAKTDVWSHLTKLYGAPYKPSLMMGSHVTQTVIWSFSPILVADEAAGWHLLSGVHQLRSGIRLRLGADAEDDGNPSPTSGSRKYQQRLKPWL